MKRPLLCLTPLLVALALCVQGCRVRSPRQPYWVEAHGRGVARRVAAAPLGAAVVGTDGLLYTYPNPSGTWRAWAETRPLVLTGSRAGVHYVDQSGRLMHIAGDAPPVVKGHAGTPGEVAALAVDGTGEVHVLREGRIFRVGAADLVPGPCPEIRAVALAAVGARLWLSDGANLHVSSGTGPDSACTRADGPAHVVRLSGNAERLLALDRTGNAHLRSASGQWQELPRPRKYRPDQSAPPRAIADVALGPTFTWAVDDEGAIFVLNDPRAPS